ncbi:TetR/AcrR family transcriptional regulator [Actinacidiphila rubida]|uniref:Transcriptional regulator, TetR family n=1 Tax=Actinacidiphila rubida TaxID=310780 RepID=A0A1H8LWB4_9ACTN|nr:TetR/AcrR family transcriptional regulator [Actinacidiphila rubida]SEO09176.1 transcriptional regulator, TetR family [Actinacidiphila rubida]
MSQPTENLRVRRTRKLLRDALVELIEERGFDRLTVGQVTERAMVSRAAFYRNYADKYQLVEQIFDEAMAELLGTVSEDAGAGPPAAERWVVFFEHIDRYHRFYAALLGAKGSPWFAAKMRASLTDMVKEHLRPPPSDSLPAAVLGAMFTQSITWWLGNGRPCTPREIATRSARLAGAVIAEANRPPTNSP